MADARIAPDVVEVRTADGRVPGRRGRETRRRLLDATHELVGQIPYRDLRVIEISRQAGTSPGTFYQYFPDIESAVLVLGAEVADEGGQRLRRLVDDPDWDDAADANTLAAGFIDFFEQERALLRVVDLAALEGDVRFRALRTRLLNGAFLALHDAVNEARARGATESTVDPSAVAGVLTSMLAHVATHRSELEAWGVDGDTLTATMAAIVDWWVRGTEGPESHVEW